MVAIIETEVFGVKAYHCKCLKCGWESKRKNSEESAIDLGRKHICNRKTIKHETPD